MIYDDVISAIDSFEAEHRRMVDLVFTSAPGWRQKLVKGRVVMANHVRRLSELLQGADYLKTAAALRDPHLGRKLSDFRNKLATHQTHFPASILNDKDPAFTTSAEALMALAVEICRDVRSAVAHSRPTHDVTPPATLTRYPPSLPSD